MGNLEGFDASSVDPKADFEPLPAGDYPGIIINSGFEKTAAGTGSFLKLELEVIDGPHRGRRLFDRLNLDNPNEKAVNIARATLSSICRAVSVLRPKDSSELHNRAMLIKVELEPRADKPGTFSNRVKNYDTLAGNTSAQRPAQQQSFAAPAANQSAAADTSVPPWKRKSA